MRKRKNRQPQTFEFLVILNDSGIIYSQSLPIECKEAAEEIISNEKWQAEEFLKFWLESSNLIIWPEESYQLALA